MYKTRIVMLLAGIVLLLPRPVFSQTGCPFTVSEAVPDTLNPKAYYPVQIGNVWEYILTDSGFLEGFRREEIVGDTLVGGDVFVKMEVTGFQRVGLDRVSITGAGFQYYTVTDSGVVRLSQAGVFTEGPRFNAPFNTCHDAGFQGRITVSGGFEQFFTIGETVNLLLPLGWPTTSVALAGIKTFSDSQATQLFGNGLGLLRLVGDPNFVVELMYARINGIQYGESLRTHFILMATEDPTPRLGPQFFSFPNPFVTSTELVFTLTQAGFVTVQMLDVLGRIVDTPMQHRFHPVGTHRLRWSAPRFASGVYTARLVLGNQPIATTRLIVVK